MTEDEAKTLKRRMEEHSIPEPNSGCLLWTAGASGGYGRISINRRSKLAHRVSWEVARGPIPAGRIVCHRCDVPMCINPDHLFLGTDADNVADMIRKGRKAPSPKGEECATAKLTESQVREILAYPAGIKKTARKFSVSRSLIGQIRQGKVWAHVPR